MKKKWYLIGGLLLTFVMSCNNQVEVTSKENGSLSLRVIKRDSVRTIIPDISMDILNYDIIGSGPDGASFEIKDLIDESLHRVLEKGKWIITVEAKNTDNTVIYRGETNCKIDSGLTTSVDIVISPLDGVGSLSLNIDWKNNILHTPNIVSTLTPSTGISKSLEFAVFGNTASYSNQNIESGYHTLIVKLFDKSILTRGAVEIVRIVKNEITEGSFIFNDINQQSGVVDINIVQELAEPLDVILTGQSTEIAENMSLTINASVPSYQNNVIYVWYINGEVKSTGDSLGSSYTISDLTKGFYRLDVTAFSIDGKRAGSATFDLTVTDPVIQKEISNITGGLYHNIALKSDGTVWAWGQNSYGQLGNNTTTDSSTPLVISGLSDVIEISSGMHHNMALKNDKTVWVWGWNAKGQLGNNTTSDSLVPIQVQGLENVKTISSGGKFSMALKEDGTVWTWGYNLGGQLGDGTKIEKHTPVKIPSISNISKIMAGPTHSYVIQNNGTIWTWGSEYMGEHGLGTKNQNRLTPVKLNGLNNLKYIFPCTYHSVALLENGSVWIWGYDGVETRLTPTRMSTINNVDTLISGNNHTFAIKKDGTLWAWRDNSIGQIGDGTTTFRVSPVKLADFSNVKKIFPTTFCTFAIKNDNTFWAWGHNNYGQLGNGSTIDSHSPIQIQAF